ncbi:putative quinol monooxygenase [Dyella humicola]|uniref:putative quinol monooxygenase n=1 Tax=Dyella humicola TaxID=2992126 RepID=UPI002253D1E8|nr:putative quinol monooxygenase [Dyella humicola]
MTQFTNLAFFRARPGQTRALGAALRAFVAPTRAESERLNYNLHRSLDEADVWLVYENWRSAEGLDAHMKAPHLQAFLEVAPNLIAGDIRLRRFSMISSLATQGA